MLGFLLGLCALVAFVKTAIDFYQESKQAKWPIVVVTITEQAVRKSSTGRYDVWYLQSELHYSIDGEALTSSIRSRVTGSTEQCAKMRSWTSQYQPDTPLSVR